MGVVASLEKEKPDTGISLLTSLVQSDMERVNRLILDMAAANAEMIPDVARHLIDSGGKRLRPMLTLASAAMFGYRGDGHVKLAASVEFMHTATLLHDDVVDESEMRRGKAAARMVWGNQASVLVGDYLLGQAFRKMVEVGSLEALAVLSNAASVIAEGEVMQLVAAKNLSTSEDEYIRVIEAKTAALFAAACEVGPIVAGADDKTRKAMADYGLYLGLAFQLVDDALDYGGSSASLGKRTGDDFREGKITLPVVIAHRGGDAQQRAFWARTIEQGTIVEGDLETATELMHRHGAIPATIERARHYGDKALMALEDMPHGDHRRSLLDVVEFCISRVH
ncbi:Octaprenyl-diphosphate synthase [Hartmannibacter diazotrophicus]|uniref:Octaprenyl diphosphate synthase n=1 Tax=Hartmannibacter diazotrophicus TaxID=1482074 RepID=A0A2C9D3E6_9HYPH|nr:polyprenyl synthetase family protein [Hartmannibacter diazotrophicus]SON54709.1 Octaprenyl-diphosphate synthase [Hartmannibacter diazotrophicus]